MMAALKAEFRKLLSVHSTYFITGLVVLVVIIIAFWPNGLNVSPADLQSPGLLASVITGALNITIFGAIIAVLLMTHEYRYSTIMYTLSASRSRSKVLAAKVITITVYALILASLVAVLSPLFADLGVRAAGHALVPQTFHVWSLVWRSLFYGWAYGMAGLVIAVLLRNQVAALVTMLLFPNLFEGLLTQLLKKHAVYLPFSSLNTLVRPPDAFAGGSLSPAHAVLIFLGYLVVAWIIAWILFLRRDAT